MSTLLGEARNLDVYRSRVVAPELERGPDELGRRDYAARIDRAREEAYDHVLKKLASKRFRLFTLDLADWIETGPGRPDSTR